ncbi:hypothetical protein F5876DRAFT_90690 [Lentinula aff. lateritia]|uniref:Uncharacterized protein n=1 Tax=Lentinula aff. lateritia TaxID=2804960 RepID=A0ACC1TRI4_9AGAR|nr:hypothetical protein F5876DRAFT_90690 [Lentinula aff. lateritia]
MVILSLIHTSNSLISTHLPPHLVCVFLGGTSGIGESTLKALVSHAVQPKIYLVGRNKASAERIIEECRGLGPQGYIGGAEVIWLKADLRGMKAVEGVLTPEGLHAFLATAYYDRTLLIAHLTPLLLNASASDSLARVVSVGCGCDEGIIYPTDFPALKIPFSAIRGHFGTLTTLTLEALAQNTVDASAGVTFIHANPVFARTLMWVKKMTGEAIGIEESGESARYAPGGVPIEDGTSPAIQTNGSRAGDTQANDVNASNSSPNDVIHRTTMNAVYSLDKNGEPAGQNIVSLLKKYREEGMIERIWAWLKIGLG